MIKEPTILHENAEFWWVAKPPGWLSVPPTQPGSIPIIKEWLAKATGQTVWAVHRLDVPTSGVLVYARNAEAHRKAGAWFEGHEIRKRYLALVSGHLPSPVMRLVQPIEGKRALTQATMKERFADACLVEARLETGRRHQIRKHLAATGHPLFGDPQYGGEDRLPTGSKVTRVALHSEAITLPGEQEITCALPDDFRGWLEELRAKR